MAKLKGLIRNTHKGPDQCFSLISIDFCVWPPRYYMKYPGTSHRIRAGVSMYGSGGASEKDSEPHCSGWGSYLTEGLLWKTYGRVSLLDWPTTHDYRFQN